MRRSRPAAISPICAEGRGTNTPVTQQTEKVSRRTIEKIVSANGKVASNRDVDIKCQASGQVTELPVDVSDKVSPGQLLMKLDPRDQQAPCWIRPMGQFRASEARISRR